jgi:hypothetical protein
MMGRLVGGLRSIGIRGSSWLLTEGRWLATLEVCGDLWVGEWGYVFGKVEYWVFTVWSYGYGLGP